MLPECPPDIGSTYPDPGAYSENRSVYITAAWNSTPPNNLPDDTNTVPAMLVIGENNRFIATKPGRSQVTYQNAPLTPEAHYCFFILTRLTTSVPNVSLLYVKMSSLLCNLAFNRYTRQVILNLLQLALVSRCYLFYHWYHCLSTIALFCAFHNIICLFCIHCPSQSFFISCLCHNSTALNYSRGGLAAGIILLLVLIVLIAVVVVVLLFYFRRYK